MADPGASQPCDHATFRKYQDARGGSAGQAKPLTASCSPTTGSPSDQPRTFPWPRTGAPYNRRSTTSPQPDFRSAHRPHDGGHGQLRCCATTLPADTAHPYAMRSSPVAPITYTRAAPRHPRRTPPSSCHPYRLFRASDQHPTSWPSSLRPRSCWWSLWHPPPVWSKHPHCKLSPVHHDLMPNLTPTTSQSGHSTQTVGTSPDFSRPNHRPNKH